MQRSDGDWRDFTQNLAIRSVLWLALRLPYERRVSLMGWIVSRVVAPAVGWNRRIAINLAHVLPELPASEVRRIQRAVADNAGRSLIEIYSGEDFVARIRKAPLTGPGTAAFLEARAAGRPVVLVTAHFGNYDAPRAALFAQGHPLAALYRPMRNARFNDHYVRAVTAIGEPAFPSDRKGILGFVRHLARGGTIGVLVDVFAIGGAPLTFFGKRAPTALSAAEWALRYNALLVPIYGIREPDGLNFRVHLDAPVPRSDAERMTQALNDSLEAQVRAHMGQWFWIHRRWAKKPSRRALRALADRGE